MLKLMKLVSTKTLYGGPSAELCLKKSEEDVASLRTEERAKTRGWTKRRKEAEVRNQFLA
jgi:hypothetical protein